MYNFYFKDGHNNNEMKLIKGFETWKEAIDYVAGFVRYDLKFTSYYFRYWHNPEDENETVVNYGSYIDDIRIIKE